MTDIETLLSKENLKTLKDRINEIIAKKNWFWVDDVDDVIQNTVIIFIDAFNRGVYTFQGEDKLIGFLIKTAVFNMKAAQKTSIKNIEHSYVISDEDDTPLIDVALDEPDPLAEKKKYLARAVNQLNPRRREVMQMLLDGYKVKDICDATGSTPAAVSGLKFNAIRDLRKSMESMGFEL